MNVREVSVQHILLKVVVRHSSRVSDKQLEIVILAMTCFQIALATDAHRITRGRDTK